MRRASEYRTMARRALKGRYANMVGGQLLGQIALSALFFAMYIIVLIGLVCFGIWSETGYYGGSFGILAGLSIGIVLFFLAMIILSMAVYAGQFKMCLSAVAGEEDTIRNMLFGFQRKLFLKFAGAYLLIMAILIGISVIGFGLGWLMIEMELGTNLLFLWTIFFYIIFIAVTIYVYLVFGMVPYIMVEQPWRGVLESLSMSRHMMQGRKWKLLCLNLSFTGWYVLTYLSWGIGSLWLMPYIICSTFFFYRDMAEKIN